MLSYNIHGLENKYLYGDFFQFVKSYDVFALLETHLGEVKIDRFRKYFKGFKTIWRAASRRSNYGRGIGGYVIGVKEDLVRKGVEFTFKTEENVDIIELKANAAIVEILPLYIRGVNWIEEFDIVKNLFLHKVVNNAVVLGDVNVRIGEQKQDIEDIYKNKFKAGIGEKHSKDKEVNSKGRSFMEFCNDYGLMVLNGCTRGDEQGNLTFISSVGQSVNDICAVSMDLLEAIESFAVINKTWSDHLPIEVTLKMARTFGSQEKEMSLAPKLNWKDNKKEEYQSALIRNLEIRKINTENIDLSSLIKLIKESYPQTLNSGIRFTSNNKWFDFGCNKARERSFKLLHKFQRSQTQVDKQAYLEANKMYKNICKRKKDTYIMEIENKINTIKDSKDWWRFAKEIRKENFHKGSNISANNFEGYFRDLLNPHQDCNDIIYAPMFYEDGDLDQDISKEEVVNVLKKVKLNKAAGDDRVPYEFLINAPDTFKEELRKVYNNILHSGNVDISFISSIIFPIYKKGNPDEACNYRGISFMNCIAKLMMGILNERLVAWVEKNQVLNEYQSGFRKNYSTTDNIFNLASIVHLKFAEGKKVYAFFVDFRAAFDKVPRNGMIYKLNNMGVSTKIVKLIEAIYKDTKSAVWTGDQFSNYFNTHTGVKQGCVMSPLLFALYINDLHETLGGGLDINGVNIRLLLYADDIVILADDVKKLQKMIDELEKYCALWNMEVNISKSEIMVFRKGGRLASQEKWMYKNEPLKIVNEYSYLGVILTPQMVFKKHLEKRNSSAKNCINATWKNFLSKSNITLGAKWKLFLAVCRSVQSYGAQIWGYSLFEEVDKLQRYFLKRILKLPDCTPTYALKLETGIEESHLFTLELHLRYINKAIFTYSTSRLPNKLALLVLEKGVFWAKEINEIGSRFDISWQMNDLAKDSWQCKRVEVIGHLKAELKNNAINRALGSSGRIYRHLDFTKGSTYFNELKQSEIMWIFKARCDMIVLNGNRFNENEARICSLCNSQEIENIQHFIGRCPMLTEFRRLYFKKSRILDNEIIDILNGKDNYRSLLNYLTNALAYRKELINYFNV